MRRKKRRRVLLSNRPNVKELDGLWAECVKARAGYKSERPPYKSKYEGNVLHAHHINGKPNYTLRWDLNNGICVTGGEHFFVAHNTGRAAEFRKRAMIIRGVTEEESSFKAEYSVKVNLFVVKAYLQSQLEVFRGRMCCE